MKPAKITPPLWLALWLALLALPGCATLPPDLSGTPVEQDAGHALLEDWLTQDRHRTLQGVARVRVQTTERTVNATQVVLAEAPDRLRAESLSPFGTPLLLLAADGSQLGVLLPGDNLFYRGRATPENFGRFTKLPLELADLVGILLFRPPLLAYRQMDAWRLADDGWRIELTAGPRRQWLLFDDARRLIEVRYISQEEAQLHVAYSDFDMEPSGLPRKIDLTLPQQNIRATLVFSELATGREFPAGLFVLQPPQSTTVISLDEVPYSGAAGNAGQNSEQPAKPRQDGSE